MLDFKFDSVPPLIIIWTVDNVFIAKSLDAALHPLGFHATISGGMEGIHPGDHGDSKHYHGMALDFRSRDWPVLAQDGILRALERNLKANGRAYHYILEGDHLHVERTL